jgi:hypothetical protein
LRKLAHRSQESLAYWEFEEDGDDVLALVQIPEPTFIKRTIPLVKGVHFRTSANKGNPEGRSILRTVYKSHYYKCNLERIEAIGLERDLSGLPLGKIPSEFLMPTASAQQKQIADAYRQILTNLRRDEQAGVLIPSDRDANGNALFELSLIGTGGTRPVSVDPVIQRYDQRIVVTALADFILLGHTAKSGSYGMSESKTHLFSVAMNSFLDIVTESFNRQLFPKLAKLNAIPDALIPKLTHDGVDEINIQELGEYIGKLSGAHVGFTAQQVAYLKEQAGIPVTDAEREGEEVEVVTEPPAPTMPTNGANDKSASQPEPKPKPKASKRKPKPAQPVDEKPKDQKENKAE